MSNVLWVVERWSEESGWEPWFTSAKSRRVARDIARRMRRYVDRANCIDIVHRVRVRRYVGEDK